MTRKMQEALNNPAVSDFVKDVIRKGLNRDVLDVYYDLKYVLELFEEWKNGDIDVLHTPVERIITKTTPNREIRCSWCGDNATKRVELEHIRSGERRTEYACTRHDRKFFDW